MVTHFTENRETQNRVIQTYRHTRFLFGSLSQQTNAQMHSKNGPQTTCAHISRPLAQGCMHECIVLMGIRCTPRMCRTVATCGASSSSSSATRCAWCASYRPLHIYHMWRAGLAGAPEYLALAARARMSQVRRLCVCV